MYLRGHALTSACRPQAGCASAQPQAVDFTFLQQARQAAYYRAFAVPSLSRAELADLAEQHLRRAAENAGWPSESWHDAAVFVGSSSYLMPEYENRHPDNGNGPLDLLGLARDLQERSGNPDIFSFAASCTSSAHALIHAANRLQRGLGRHAFVLGLESLNRLTLLHFHSLGLLASDCRPFGGDGLVLGEGIAALAFSAQAGGTAHGRTSRLLLKAHAANTGTASAVQGDSAMQAQLARSVLASAGIAPADVRAVKTHGIGIAQSDAAEREALEQVFGTPLPPLLAFKPLVGHTLGAAAALETAMLAEALQNGNGGTAVFSDGHYLSSHFGFGGSNTTMVWQWTK